MTATATQTVDCFKCQGAGRLSFHAHIDNGVCYQCRGTGRLNAGRADVGTGRVQASRTVDLGAFGEARVTRFGAGFQAHFTGGAAWFNVVAGRVVDFEVSDAAARNHSALLSAFQAAVKV